MEKFFYTRFFKAANMAIAPWRAYTRPLYFNIDKIPEERPLLFVGNHTLVGMLDVPLMAMKLYEEKKIFLRPLGDHLHFKIPIWKEYVKMAGAVDGSRENCAKLFKDKQCVLVFPGGAGEVTKNKGEEYKLLWRERYGFVKMALEHGCTIQPFAAVGADDQFDILFDSSDMEKIPALNHFKRLFPRKDLLFPLIKGIGPTLIPKPERYYFSFGDPIKTDQLKTNPSNDQHLKELRNKVQKSVESLIEEILEYRSSDPDRFLF